MGNGMPQDIDQCLRERSKICRNYSMHTRLTCIEWWSMAQMDFRRKFGMVCNPWEDVYYLDSDYIGKVLVYCHSAKRRQH